MNFSIEVMVLQPTSMPSTIILGGGAAKTDNIKVWNNDWNFFFFFWFVKKTSLKPCLHYILDSF